MKLIEEYNSTKIALDSIPSSDIFPDGSFSSDKSHSTDSSSKKNDQALLKYLSQYCDTNLVRIKEISQSFVSDKDSTIIETDKIVLEGSYQNTISLIFKIEKVEKLASINSIKWEIQKDSETGLYALSSIVYIKHIIHENK